MTANWAYARLRRTAYSDEELGRIADELAAHRLDEAWVYFKHEDEGTGPKLAKRFLAALELKKHVFLGRKVEEERAVSNARGGDDRGDVGVGHARPFELGDGRPQQPFPGLQPLRLASRDPVRHSDDSRRGRKSHVRVASLASYRPVSSYLSYDA